MTDDVRDIPPALTADQWTDRVIERDGLAIAVEGATLADENRIMQGDATAPRRLTIGFRAADPMKIWMADVNMLSALIALANHAMNDEDPRKLTREHVERLRSPTPLHEDDMAKFLAHREFLGDLADVIESYLPPEPKQERSHYVEVDG